jgi:hypothetical protein
LPITKNARQLPSFFSVAVLSPELVYENSAKQNGRGFLHK